MERQQLLKNDSRFGGYEIAARISTHHVGEREVYRAKNCKNGELVALIVFNLDCKRYKSDRVGRKRPCGEDIDLDALAQATENYTCSDLSYIVKESARRCFDETIATGADSPIPLSQRHLLDVIEHTQSSVSPAELKSYKEMRERIEHRDGNKRPRVGFFTAN